MMTKNEVLELAAVTWPNVQLREGARSIVNLVEGKTEILNDPRNYYFVERVVIGFGSGAPVQCNDDQMPSINFDDQINEALIDLYPEVGDYRIAAGTSENIPWVRGKVHELCMFCNVITLNYQSAIGTPFTAVVTLWTLHP